MYYTSGTAGVKRRARDKYHRSPVTDVILPLVARTAVSVTPPGADGSKVSLLLLYGGPSSDDGVLTAVRESSAHDHAPPGNQTPYSAMGGYHPDVCG